MLEARPEHSPSATVLIEKSGRFFCYEPGLALIASDNSAGGTYDKFVAARRDFFEKIGQLGLETTRLGAQAETAAPTPTLQLVGRAIMADLGLFLGKTCIVLLVIAGIGVAAAVRVSPLLSGLPPTMSISMTDVADKASMMVRDVQAMPHESKESLRQNVGILSRELSPIIEAWRTPPAPEGKTDPVSPAPATSPRR